MYTYNTLNYITGVELTYLLTDYLLTDSYEKVTLRKKVCCEKITIIRYFF